MAGPPADQIKARIITYMNTDRPSTLESYLRHYNKLTPTPSTAKLIDFDLSYLKIEYLDPSTNSTKTSTVKIDPPMESLSDSRVRFVAMHEEATGETIHGVNPPVAGTPNSIPQTTKAQIKWTPPGLTGLSMILLTVFGFWSLSHEYPLSEGGPLESVLPRFLVGIARAWRQQIFSGMIGIHGMEMLIVAQRCIENKVDTGTALVWCVETLVEGWPVMLKLEKEIERSKI
jgi:Protein of unknown function (DUF2470)/Domain of unknown function (DUF4499)